MLLSIGKHCFRLVIIIYYFSIFKNVNTFLSKKINKKEQIWMPIE